MSIDNFQLSTGPRSMAGNRMSLCLCFWELFYPWRKQMYLILKLTSKPKLPNNCYHPDQWKCRIWQRSPPSFPTKLANIDDMVWKTKIWSALESKDRISTLTVLKI